MKRIAASNDISKERLRIPVQVPGRKREFYLMPPNGRDRTAYYVRFDVPREIRKARGLPHCMFRSTGTDVLAAARERAAAIIRDAFEPMSEAVELNDWQRGLPPLIRANAERLRLIEEPAIYFLMRAGAVQYVGQTVNILLRLGAHLRRRSRETFMFDEVVFIRTPLESLTEREGFYIAKLKPPLNKVWPGGTRRAKLRSVSESVAADRASAS